MRLRNHCRVELQLIKARRQFSQYQSVMLNFQPAPGDKGSISHYYHFIFDLVLPLARLLHFRNNGSKSLYIRDFGVLSHRVQELFPGVHILKPGESVVAEEIMLYGMNPRSVFLRRGLARRFSRWTKTQLAIDPCPTGGHILLIDRLHPARLGASYNDDSGAARRSIQNMAVLEKTLRDLVRPPYELLSTTLEDMTLRDQVALFSGASLVIGQHGAAFANILWMTQPATMLEFYNFEGNYFRRLAKAADVKHLAFVTGANHTAIDPSKFGAWIAKQPSLRLYFETGALTKLTNLGST